jgi:hypothetical protein
MRLQPRDITRHAINQSEAQQEPLSCDAVRAESIPWDSGQEGRSHSMMPGWINTNKRYEAQFT